MYVTKPATVWHGDQAIICKAVAKDRTGLLQGAQNSQQMKKDVRANVSVTLQNVHLVLHYMSQLKTN